MQTKKDELKQLYSCWANENVLSVEKMPESGSNREYYRIISKNKTAIGVINSDKAENIAFLDFSKNLKKCGIKVPQIYAVDSKIDMYIQEDLGDMMLYNYVEEKELKKKYFDDELVEKYKKSLKQLIKCQIFASDKIDYSLCYPRSAFDRQSMQWDLNYFKYYFLKLANIPFNEQLLENDFDTFIKYLLDTDTDYFLYRDFQSRNIMLKDDEVYFIDYQGGRRGALQYDLASLLYDAKANMPNSIREKLLAFYIKELKTYKKIDKKLFVEKYYGYVLIRILQAMGAFGFRGFFERKKHFLESIPYALQNLDYLLNEKVFNIEIPYLLGVLEKLSSSEKLKNISK